MGAVQAVKPYYERGGITIYHGDLCGAVVVQCLDSLEQPLSGVLRLGIECPASNADLDVTATLSGQRLRLPECENGVSLFGLDSQIRTQDGDGVSRILRACSPVKERSPVSGIRTFAGPFLDVPAEAFLEQSRDNGRQLAEANNLAICGTSPDDSFSHADETVSVYRTAKISQFQRFIHVTILPEAGGI